LNQYVTRDKINFMRKLWWVLLFLGILTLEFLLFLPCLDSYFISEDFWQLAFARFTENPFTVLYCPYYGSQFWRPLFQLINALAWPFFGTEPVGYHVLTVFFHSLNTLLVAVLCYLVLSVCESKAGWRFLASVAVALYFGLHPIASLTTIWFTCFEDLLGVFFLLLSLILIWPARSGLGLLAFLTSMLAFLSKETLLTLPALALLIGFIRADTSLSSLKEKVISAIKTAIPCIAAFTCYMAWRLAVVRGIGGYETLSLHPDFLLPRMTSHIPPLLDRATRDILFHHLSSVHSCFYALLVSYLVLFAAAIIPALRRSARLLVFLCLFSLITIAPLWNASHMLVFREERLLYLPLLSAALILGLLLIGPDRPLVKVFLLSISALVIYFLASASRGALEDWQGQAERNRSITQALRARIKGLSPDSRYLRIYLVGLSPEDYALDPMIKIHLDQESLGHSFMLGEYESLVWKPASAKAPESLPDKIPPEALPEEKGAFYNSGKYLISSAPPDLLIAVRHDPQARVYEWKGDLLIDLNKDLRDLFFKRNHTQLRYNYPEGGGDREFGTNLPYRYLFLPSFSFYNLSMPLQWELSPDLSYFMDQPIGEPRGFIALTSDPYLVSPALSFPALAAAAVEIEMKIEPRTYLPAQEREGTLFWMSEGEKEFSPLKQIRFQVKADGKFHRYLFDLNRSFAWCRSGNIKKIRFDPISYPGRFWLKRIEFLPKNWENFKDTKPE
jgi:hypothetical protein